ADLAGDRLPDLLLGRVRIAVEQGAGRHQHSRRTEAALQPVTLHEAALDGVELAEPLQTFYRAHLVSGCHGCQDGARLDRLAVQPDGTRAAVAGVATPVRAGQGQVIAQE